MYRKTHKTMQLELKRKKCAAMRAAKERKRMADAVSLQEVGGFVTWGNLGMHDVRLLAYPDGERLAVAVDGRHKQARTFRGVLRCVAEMIRRKL